MEQVLQGQVVLGTHRTNSVYLQLDSAHLKKAKGGIENVVLTRHREKLGQFHEETMESHLVLNLMQWRKE
ncbi:hypothetical protein SCLCIDRAFT_1225496 [Scleroderma citrinum Foug A]|uniref:Uncharacterized protein n=1 Tax=Scleroderma citrinum Foug A TaxID=1036808 RepID=A0A0C3CN11_9AGAM|nr:hypothetical protein SCLCIDRAFT_1225496 [Scleroderma citrinum Foug A]